MPSFHFSFLPFFSYHVLLFSKLYLYKKRSGKKDSKDTEKNNKPKAEINDSYQCSGLGIPDGKKV